MVSELSIYTMQVIAIAFTTLLASVVLISNPKNTDARLVALACISNISYALVRLNFYPTEAYSIELGVLLYPLHVLQNIGAGCWMMLCFRVFQDRQDFPRVALAAFATQMLLSAAKPMFIPYRIAEIDMETIGETTYFVFGSLPLILQAIFGGAALYWALKGWGADLLETRRLLRLLITVLISLGYFGVTATEMLMIELEMGSHLVLNMIITTSMPIYVSIIALSILRVDLSALERVARSVQAQDLQEQESDWDYDLQRFQRVFRDEKSYLQPGLCIADLARKLQIPQYRLRALINRKLGYRNFNALLNEYRIKDACDRFASAENDHLPILTIALESGYQSIAPFNQAFKEMKKVTPSAYRKQLRAEFSPIG